MLYNILYKINFPITFIYAYKIRAAINALENSGCFESA